MSTLEKYHYENLSDIWDKVFKNGTSKICGRQPLKSFTWAILEYFIPYKASLLRSLRYDCCFLWKSRRKAAFWFKQSIYSKIYIPLQTYQIQYKHRMNRFHILFQCFYCWLWTSKCWLGSRFEYMFLQKKFSPCVCDCIVKIFWNYSTHCSGVIIADFDQVTFGWVLDEHMFICEKHYHKVHIFITSSLRLSEIYRWFASVREPVGFL